MTKQKAVPLKADGTRAARTTAANKGTAKAKATKKRLARTKTTHRLVWRDVTCRITHTPDYISKGWTHLELIVMKPKGAPVPITSTGYLSHFLDEDLLAKHRGPVAFFLGWIEREARTKRWAKAEFKWRQLELFAR
jgi:hypothetical protein